MRIYLSLILAALTVSFGCNSTQEPTKKETETKQTVVQKTEPKPATELVVYSGRSAKLVDPIFKKFEAKTKIKVQVRSGKSDELANRIALEGANSEADVIFLQESGYLEVLGRNGLLSPLAATVANTLPQAYVGTDRNWVGVSGRARVLVYSTDTVKVEELPKTLNELADSKWQGQFGWAPTNASFEAHVSALRHFWGEEKTKAWLLKMKTLSPKRYPKNSPQVRAVDNGEIKIGWVNHYYLLKQKAANPKLKAANYSFPVDQDPGNLMMLSGAAVVKSSKRQGAAAAFIEFLLSEEIQTHLTQKNFEYPTVKGIPLGAGLVPISKRLSAVPQEHLTDIAGTQKLLQSIGLR